MAQFTPNYDLVKPAQEDFYNVDDQNRNMDKIDTALKAHDDSLAGKADLGEDGKVKPEQLPDSSSDPTEAIEEAINTHNESPSAHADIRETVKKALSAAQTAQETADSALKAVSGLIYTIDVVPSQNGTLTYNGGEQSPSWNSYNPETLTLGGTTTATNAGTYTATFTPKGKYKWTDGTQTPKQVTWTINRATVSVPSQSGSLTYTGSTQSPTWAGYDSSKMTIGGTTSGTNAGSYNATFTPGSNYQWTDGGSAEKAVAWTIGKATGSLSLNKSSISLNVSKMSDTITVTRPGTGVISAVSSAPSVASVSVSGNVVTVTGKAKGNATITVSVAADTNYTAPADKTCSVNVTLPTNTLNDNDWATIKQVSDSGKGSSYWAVGDMKSIQINGKVGNFTFSNLTINTFILGFNHNSGKEGNNKIHFQIGKIGREDRRCNFDHKKPSFLRILSVRSELRLRFPERLPPRTLFFADRKTSARKVSIQHIRLVSDDYRRRDAKMSISVFHFCCIFQSKFQTFLILLKHSATDFPALLLDFYSDCE